VLGIDGGGTATHALVADEKGEVRGFAISGASNWENVGIQSAIDAIGTASRSALAAAGASPADVRGAVYGLAGIDFASDEREMSVAHASLELECPFQVLNDSFVALRAGTNHPWGVVVVAGTGSVVAGRNPAAEVVRTFGLGPIFGDDGSASEVSLEAITAVAAEILGTGPRTALTDKLVSAAGAPDPMTLIEGLAKGHIPNDRFAPQVFEAAEAGDLVARRILERAGASLGDRAGHVARHLSMESSEFELVLAGQMFHTQSHILRSALEATMKRSAPFAFAATLEAPAVVGAALLALELADASPDRDVHARLSVGAIERLNRAT
jgi:N-acetylglucosamine kinase-like BadF-type ATPase